MRISTFAAFSNRNYRLYFFGQFISMIGSWMQQTAVSWMVFSQTQSTEMLGLCVFFGQCPTLILSILGGRFSDQFNRRTIVLITQAGFLLQAGMLAALSLHAPCKVWEIIVLNVFNGVLYSFDIPARNAMIYDLFDSDNGLPNALALNYSIVNLARFVGPPLAVFILQSSGYSVCFILNMLSFFAIFGSLLKMKMVRHSRHTQRSNLSIREGFNYIRSNPVVGRLLIFAIFSNLAVVPFASLMPAYIQTIFHGSATLFGKIEGCIGLGALIGTLYLASLNKHTRRIRLLMIVSGIFGVSLIFLGCSRHIMLSSVLAAFTGFGLITQATLVSTIVQGAISSSVRGRVIGYFTMAYYGTTPAGILLAGFFCDRVGVLPVLVIEGVASVLGVTFLIYHFAKSA